MPVPGDRCSWSGDFFAELGLWQILDAGRRWPRLLPDENPDDDWPSRVLALIANRLTRPGSEHALGAWLESDYVCDRRGSRYVPCWKQQGRVQIDLMQLQSWYRTLDHLLLNKDKIEVALLSTPARLVRLPARSRVLRSDEHLLRRSWSVGLRQAWLQPGRQAPQRTSRGGGGDGRRVADRASRLGRQHARQQDGAGGGRGLVEAFRFSPSGIRGRPGNGDREETSMFWRKPRAQWGFLVGMTRRQNPEAESLIDRVDESHWIDCPAGITAQEKSEPPRTRVQEVSCDRKGVRVFVVDSDERRAYEQRMREKVMERARVGLQKVQARVEKGQLKKAEKIGAAVERVMQRHHGHRYYDWALEDGRLRYFEHPVNLPREKKYEGKYLIQTDQANMTPEEAVAQYKELNEVERGFHALKDPIGMRPIWHRVERRVRAHIFVAALAFLMDRMLERTLKDGGAALSAQAAWSALQTVRHVSFRVQGQLRSGVAPGSSRARQVLKALKLSDTRPPTPPKGEETTM